ncbi:MAG: TetR family transcriptional regulator, partial [Aeromicrobium sp.]|nr:TetR family transcriptional regulator [Aeromicrobium sp.]
SGAPERFDELVVEAHISAAVVLFDRAVERGEIGSDTPTVTLIECLYGGVTMSAINLRSDERDLTHPQVVERVTPLIDLLFAALKTHATV